MTSKADPKRLRLLFLTVGILVLAAGLTPALAQEPCPTCHEDEASGFTGTSHGRYFAADERYQSASCESCHGSGEEHANSDGEAKILNPAKGVAEEANATCLSCHESNPSHANWQGSPHQLAGNKCGACHDVHQDLGGTPRLGDKLPGPMEPTVKCMECHGDVRASLHQRSTHPLRDGQMGCTSCHNPHGAPGEKLIEKASINDLCYSCHQQVRGPFLWEHSPVREDCLNCHRAHGSNYPSILQARVTQLCQSCHQQGRHQTLAGLPDSVWLSNRACLNCHSRIHGSNHPSGPLFQR